MQQKEKAAEKENEPTTTMYTLLIKGMTIL